MLIMAVVCFMGALCFSVEARLNSGGLSGELYADVFGDVYVQKNAAFGVGKVNSSGQSACCMPMSLATFMSEIPHSLLERSIQAVVVATFMLTPLGKCMWEILHFPLMLAGYL